MIDSDSAQDVASLTARPNPCEAALRLDRFIPYRLNVAALLVSRGLARIYAERFAIGIPEWRVIAILGEQGPLTAKAIGALSHMHKTKVSRAVAALLERRFVDRAENEADRREAFVALSPTGRKVYEYLAPLALAYAAELTAGVDPADLAAFDRVLDHLRRRCEGLAEQFIGEDE